MFSESPIPTVDLTSRASVHRLTGTLSGHRGDPPNTHPFAPPSPMC